MTWYVTISVLGAIWWQAGPMTQATCEKEHLPAVIEQVDQRTNKQGVVEFQGRTARREDVRVYCTEEAYQ